MIVRLLLLILVCFTLTSGSAKGDYFPDKRELDCLSTMVYHESRGEGRKGMLAVAYVAINRAEKNPELWGSTICEVVRKPYQFDGMRREHHVIREEHAWEEAKEVSKLAFYGMLRDPTKGAVYFHANYIKPSWAYVKVKTLALGNHIFYK